MQHPPLNTQQALPEQQGRWSRARSGVAGFDDSAVGAAALIDGALLVLAIVLGLGLRLWQINALGFNTDEAVYAGQAAGIIGDPALKPYFPVFRAHPLLSQFIVSLAYLFTGTSDIVARYYSVIIGMLTILLVYATGKALYGRRAGAVAALLLAVTPYHVIVTRQFILDGPMAFCATLTLYCLVRFAATERPAWLYAVGAGMGLTFLAKESYVIVIGAIYAFLALSSSIKVRVRDLVISLLCMAVVIAPFPISVSLAGGSRSAQSYLVWQLLRRPNHDWLFYPTTVTMAIGPLVILAALLGLWRLRSFHSWREVLLLSWVIVPVAFFQIWPVKGFQYLLPTAPALVILAARALTLWNIERQASERFGWLRFAAAAVVVVSLLVPSWQRVQPSTSDTFLAGSGGVPGGREAGEWINAHVPEGAKMMTIGPSMANILQFYGHRKAYGLAVSPNPLHRNPSYEPVINPDQQIRYAELQYLVWDSFSAARSSFFSDSMMRYVARYHGRIVHSQTVPVREADGSITQKPIIVIYEVRP